MRSKLLEGRESYRRRQWAAAFRLLSQSDETQSLAVGDLELLAVAAYLVGRDDEFFRALDRAHHAYLEAGDEPAAVRCAFWIGLRRFLRGETGPAVGWLGRGQRILDRSGEDCAERGYLLLPVAEQQIGAGDLGRAEATASSAVEIGERHDDADLVASARHLLGRVLIQRQKLDAGLAMLDEAMVAVTSGELSPLITGLVYCSVIDACEEVFEMRRAGDWTAALGRWCDGQPEMVAFTGTCLVRRAELMIFHGAWAEAEAEARRACERYASGIDPQRPAAAYYQLGEVHRLRGEYAAAEAAYRDASRFGREPQPGLALLRLAQGRTRAAAAAIRRVLGETTGRLRRARLLQAQVEIMLAADDLEAARLAGRELEEVAELFDTGALEALAAQARGAIALAEGDARAALGSLRQASSIWQRLEAPYLAARARVLVAAACRALGDADAVRFELDAARAAFQGLGATPDLAGAGSAATAATRPVDHGLSPRELEVLRLIAAGLTNRAIAAELFISDKTVARHVSNIFNKLGLSTRAAATAYAYQNDLA